MEIVPIHYVVSMPVRKYFEIEDDAANMMQMLDVRGFRGHHDTGYALAHAQVCPTPFSFFVLDQALIEDGSYEHRVIINPKVLKAPLYEEKGKKHALDKIVGVVRRPNYLEYEEGCLSFPHRRGKRLNRYNRIKVTYQVKGGLFGLKRVTRWLDGLASQVFQHEYDHCMGQNIYFKAHKENDTVSYMGATGE